uniref:Death associated protein n=1 Tax=Theropithecus gelada TaxID=9565 RepID=A0A8D2JUR1_THEGE
MTRNGKAPVHLNPLCSSLGSLPGVTKISPRRPRRWLTRSRMPPWTSILPQEPSTSSSHASEPGPHQPPPRPRLFCTWYFPDRENQHFLPNPALLGNLRQNQVLCRLPYISIFKTRNRSSPNLVYGESGWMSFEDDCAPRGAISRICQDLRKTFSFSSISAVA